MPVHIWDLRWPKMCVGISILRDSYLVLYTRVYWGWRVCCFLGPFFFGVLVILSQNTYIRLCGQKVELLNAQLAVYIVTTGLQTLSAMDTNYSLAQQT